MDELNNKSNIFDYINWRGDLTFDKSPINKIDIAILTQIAIINLKDIVPDINSDDSISIYDAFEKFHEEKRDNKQIGLIIPFTIIRLFNKIHKMPRYKDIRIMYYLEDIDLDTEMQISASTFKINDNEFVISFSGTDDTIIGWKENFNMMYKFPVNSQIHACKYVSEVMDKNKDAFFYLSGHSKGGNMVLYSSYAISDDHFKRVINAYSYDGQGLSPNNDDFFKDNRNKKIISFVPESSVVGVLFDHKEKTYYIKSIQDGAYQHDLLSWLVKGSDFVYAKGLSKEGLAVKEKTREIIGSMTDVEREKFSTNLYVLLSVGNSKDLMQLNENKFKLWEAYFKMPKNERKYLSEPIRKLLKDKNIQRTVFDTLKGMANDNKKKKQEKKEIKE